jgi:nicotinamidase/pyrazinamidase
MRIAHGDALIVTDVQYDFCPGGALPVQRGDEVVPVVNRLLPLFPLAVASRDWHPPDHVSFAAQHPGKRPLERITLPGGGEQVLWPVHCVQGSRGADFHPGLDQGPLRTIFHKGTSREVDSYSVFRDNDRRRESGLRGYLRGLGAGRVFVCGLATDFCVRATVLDALEMGFAAVVVRDACRGVDQPPGSEAQALEEIARRGALVLQSSEILAG